MTVKVDVPTAEDAWALRIWNVIQGLRTLRDTGMTRELEVWGILDGQVINGCIDELSYTCPDRELEAATLSGKVEKPDPPAVAADQLTIQDFFKQNKGTPRSQADEKIITTSPRENSKVYITDIKTRSVPSLPKGASFRPTMMQLMLYHRLLSSLAENKVDPNIIFNRYRLESDKIFSDSFITSVSELYYDAPSELNDAVGEEPPLSSDTSTDTLQTMLDHNNLNSLWILLGEEFKKYFPQRCCFHWSRIANGISHAN